MTRCSTVVMADGALGNRLAGKSMHRPWLLQPRLFPGTSPYTVSDRRLKPLTQKSNMIDLDDIYTVFDRRKHRDTREQKFFAVRYL